METTPTLVSEQLLRLMNDECGDTWKVVEREWEWPVAAAGSISTKEHITMISADTDFVLELNGQNVAASRNCALCTIRFGPVADGEITKLICSNFTGVKRFLNTALKTCQLDSIVVKCSAPSKVRVSTNLVLPVVPSPRGWPRHSLEDIDD